MQSKLRFLLSPLALGGYATTIVLVYCLNRFEPKDAEGARIFAWVNAYVILVMLSMTFSFAYMASSILPERKRLVLTVFVFLEGVSIGLYFFLLNGLR